MEDYSNPEVREAFAASLELLPEPVRSQPWALRFAEELSVTEEVVGVALDDSANQDWARSIEESVRDLEDLSEPLCRALDLMHKIERLEDMLRAPEAKVVANLMPKITETIKESIKRLEKDRPWSEGAPIPVEATDRLKKLTLVRKWGQATERELGDTLALTREAQRKASQLAVCFPIATALEKVENSIRQIQRVVRAAPWWRALAEADMPRADEFRKRLEKHAKEMFMRWRASVDNGPVAAPVPLRAYYEKLSRGADDSEVEVQNYWGEQMNEMRSLLRAAFCTHAVARRCAESLAVLIPPGVPGDRTKEQEREDFVDWMVPPVSGAFREPPALKPRRLAMSDPASDTWRVSLARWQGADALEASHLARAWLELTRSLRDDGIAAEPTALYGVLRTFKKNTLDTLLYATPDKGDSQFRDPERASLSELNEHFLTKLQVAILNHRESPIALEPSLIQLASRVICAKPDLWSARRLLRMMVRMINIFTEEIGPRYALNLLPVEFYEALHKLLPVIRGEADLVIRRRADLPRSPSPDYEGSDYEDAEE